MQTTLASVVSIMSLLRVDLSWATHRKVLSKSDSRASPIVNVMDYGAHASGLNDDRTAFQEAWEAACMAPSDAVLHVPAGNRFLVTPVTFLGPCKSRISVQIAGTIVAPNQQQSAWNSSELSMWLRFSGISGLTIEGGGVIDGQGKDWWSKSCKVQEQQVCVLLNTVVSHYLIIFHLSAIEYPRTGCLHAAPTAMYITGCSNVLIRNLQFVNSQQMHLAVLDSSEIQLSGLQIQAPVDSPNTDGIHLERVHNDQIDNCVIGTGDDCISISSGSSAINVKNINCGPGHGISIGSLGGNGQAAKIDDIFVQNITFRETSNGVRIKTWQGGSGYARNITFEDIVVDNVMNPIIIDQYYCDSSSPCKMQPSAVHVQNVNYKNIHGTSSMNVAVNFSCSETVACTGITLTDVQISSTAATKPSSICTNALGMALGTTSPPSCLQN